MHDHRGTARIVSCPTCGTAVEWHSGQRWRPFCSERCRLIDLGQWLDESHRIAADETESGILDEQDSAHQPF